MTVDYLKKQKAYEQTATASRAAESKFAYECDMRSALEAQVRKYESKKQ